MLTPPEGQDWVGLDTDELPIASAAAWSITPGCGALCTFAGTVRDHAPGRPDVQFLVYEAYEEQVLPRLSALVVEARRRWPMLGRVVLLHRLGRLELAEVSVFVAATSPSRPEAFVACRFLIDALKATVPIWKHETWAGGAEWSDGTCVVDEPGELSLAAEHGHGGAEALG